MYFFITSKIDSLPSAIELAMIQRQKLFTKHRVPALIVTRNFVRDLHQNMKKLVMMMSFKWTCTIISKVPLIMRGNR